MEENGEIEPHLDESYYLMHAPVKESTGLDFVRSNMRPVVQLAISYFPPHVSKRIFLKNVPYAMVCSYLCVTCSRNTCEYEILHTSSFCGLCNKEC